MGDCRKIDEPAISWIKKLKKKIVLARQKAALSLNSALIELYWYIGKEMVENEVYTNWCVFRPDPATHS